MSRTTLKKGRCTWCKKRCKAGRYVHAKCARHLIVFGGGVYRQLSLLDEHGDVRAVVRWAGSLSIQQIVVPRGPEDAPTPKRPEDYEHTPGKCARCGGRVRNKENKFHRLCERLVYNPPPPPKRKPLVSMGEFPEPTYCEPCHSLDNSFAPAQVCPKCDRPTGPVPDWMRPKPSAYGPPKRTRIRGR